MRILLCLLMFAGSAFADRSNLEYQMERQNSLLYRQNQLIEKQAEQQYWQDAARARDIDRANKEIVEAIQMQNLPPVVIPAAPPAPKCANEGQIIKSICDDRRLLDLICE